MTENKSTICVRSSNLSAVVRCDKVCCSKAAYLFKWADNTPEHVSGSPMQCIMMYGRAPLQRTPLPWPPRISFFSVAPITVLFSPLSLSVRFPKALFLDLFSIYTSFLGHVIISYGFQYHLYDDHSSPHSFSQSPLTLLIY